MSLKTSRSRKQHTAEISIASIGNLEVISEENFLKRLEGMSSCEDCKHERSKSMQSKHRRPVKNKKKFRQQKQARTNSPIVIKLSDTLKLQKSRRRGSKGAKMEEENVTVNTTSSGNISSNSLEMASSKSEKNFSAMISILEKCHQKHFSSEFSLNLNMDSSLCSQSNVLLNNTRSPLPHTRNTPTSPKQFFVLSNNVDVICNDLSGKPGSVVGDDSSLLVQTHSQAENGGPNTILVDKDLSRDEMSQLVEYTTGFAVTRFDCMQLDCADCISWPSTVAKCRSVEDHLDPDDDTDNSSESSDATDTDSATVISTSFSSSSRPSVSESTSSSSPVSSSDEHSSTTAETSSDSDEDEKQDVVICSPITKPKTAKAECALITKPKVIKMAAATCTKPKTVKATCSTKTFKKESVTVSTKGNSTTQEKRNKKSAKDKTKSAPPQIFTIQSKTGAVQGDSVYIDLTDCDVEISVFYHPKPTEYDWCYPSSSAAPCYDGYWYYPTMPYTYFPSYYMQPPVVSIPRPLCVPRDQDILASSKTCMIPAHEIENFTATQPAQRPWIPLAHPERNRPTAIFTVMCYNVLCDKYCTRQQYGYCPTWALSWEYRKKGIIEEIRHYSADIISLQEVETDQFYHFFLPELKHDGYEGVFAPKSRARTMSENERKHVDGCAIFFRTSKFSLLKEHLMEFNQIAMASAEGSHDMLNRVMTKDNIGLAALLETKEGVFENGIPPDNQIRQPILVATAHVHWDPEYSDVKLIQTMMLMSDLKNFIEETTTSLRPGAPPADCNSLPLILCADLNSLPESGVIEYLVEGKIAAKHVDFKDLGYEDCLQKLTTIDNPDFLGHDFRLSRSYSDDVMPYTNYTFDFKGVIDYIIFSRDYMTTLGILGRIDPDWFKDNKVIGCPHPHIPSDHFALLAEFELHVPYPTNTRGNTNNFHGARR